MSRKLAIILVILVSATLTACQQKNDDLTFYGTAEMEQINMSPEIAGVIQEISIAEGAGVSKGDLVAVIAMPDKDLRIEQAQLILKQAENELERIKEDARLKDTKVQTAAELGVQSAQNALELAEQTLEKNEIKAANEGMVSTINYSEGEYIMPGSALATLVNPNNMWVNIYVPEAVLPKLSVNQEVRIQSDFVDGDIKGSIVNISEKAEYTPMNIVTKDNREKLVYEVKVQLKDNNAKLKAGMLLDVMIE